MSRSVRPCLTAWLLVLCALSPAPGLAQAAHEGGVRVEGVRVALTGEPFALSVHGCAGCEYEVRAGGETHARGKLNGDPAAVTLSLSDAGEQVLDVQVDGRDHRVVQRVMPGWLSITPPLAAIALAIFLRNVLVALGAGLWLGAWSAFGGGPFVGLLRAFDTYLWGTLKDSGNQSILIFSLMLGGLIGLIAEGGGGAGLATQLTRLATTRARAAVSIWSLGVLLFFDDYVSTLLVGSSMRPLADRMRISREKLAFLADATSAPIASLAIASSWIGMELGYIADQARSLELGRDAYSLFLASLPYRFYPWLMLAFGLYIALRGKDFGPMLRAEQQALAGASPGGMQADPEFDSIEVSTRESHWAYAVLPIGVTVTGITGMLLYTGLSARDFVYGSLGQVLSAASGSRALLVGASAGCLTAAVALGVGRVLPARGIGIAFLKGVRSVSEAMVVLMCAWALGVVCRDLSTARFLISLLDGVLSAALVPAVVFLVAALTSFSTGSSWGTIGLVFPLAVPLAHELSSGDPTIVVSAIGSILAGSVWGDHCSPISDTTIMSSMAAGCDHVAHVRTQLPYALSVGIVAMLVGDLGTALGWYGPLTALLLAALVLVAWIELLGRRPAAAC